MSEKFKDLNYIIPNKKNSEPKNEPKLFDCSKINKLKKFGTYNFKCVYNNMIFDNPDLDEELEAKEDLKENEGWKDKAIRSVLRLKDKYYSKLQLAETENRELHRIIDALQQENNILKIRLDNN